MSFIKSFSSLTTQTRSYVSARALHPKKFTSILSNVPTRPSSAWQFYLTENLNGFKTSDGKVDLKRASQELSKQWKGFSEEQKKPYVEKYQAKSKEHVEALEKALNNATPQQFFEENSLRRKYKLTLLKDPKHPKHPKGPFFLYLEHLRATNDPIYQSGKSTEQVAEAAKKYKSLPEQEIKVFRDKAKFEKEQYDAAMKKYMSNVGV
ncbi:uncharacterized protein B0P05DRAFT_544280 [Gilbertella persicaria]|uniref:uncharacterized protein n=1 Tax=Gilbertella persicaria TaxID=101096 RepID=UPI0022201F9B|nr:uncharacterized protein B0P05DRAFT_544280 [Gilbertella persicaria]KAI8077267.1 hypothetical protein B0P05DRAFT_544280 [Gilbertella persicaria]